jgi:glycosyltransferase involved in cell wall biosynthesis
MVSVGNRDFALDDSLIDSLEKPVVVVGIPAFNEEKTIARVVLEAQKHAHVVVVCDDGSTDLTGEIAIRFGAVVIKHEVNRGYGCALRSLFRNALELNADVLVTLDADGQHEPAEIPSILKPVIDGVADIVIGSRFIAGREAEEMPMYRRAGAKVITKLVNGPKHKVTDAQSGFRAYGRQAIRNLSIVEDGMGASVEILFEAYKRGLKICEVPSSCRYENNRMVTSKSHPVAHGLGVVKSIARLVVEDNPLVFLGIPGVLCLVLGMSFGTWLLQIYALTHQIITNVALASLAFVSIGFVSLYAAITLYAISRLSDRIDARGV